MKQNNLALTFQLEQYRAIFKSPYIRGLASAIALTAGGVSSYAHAAANDGVLDTDEWLNSLKANGTVTITGNDADKGSGGKFSQVHITGASGDGVTLELKGEEKLLIDNTTHPYTDNYFEAGASQKLNIRGEGTIDVAAEGSSTNPGLFMVAKGGGKLNVDVGNINVQSNLQIATHGDASVASVAAKNIVIGNNKFSGSDDKPEESGRATIHVGGTVGAPQNFSGDGTSTLGNESSNITVNRDGKIRLTSGKNNTVKAANVTVEGGVLSFAEGKKGGTATYQVANTDVNDGNVTVKSGSNITIKGGSFNVNGKSYVDLSDKLTVDGASLNVADTAVIAGHQDAAGKGKIEVKGNAASEGTLNLSKDKLISFLTAKNADGSQLQYVDENKQFKDPTNKMGNATSGGVVLSSGGGINFTDSHVELADGKLKFSDKGDTGAITLNDNSFVRGQHVSISKNIENAAKLNVQAKTLTLGSQKFDSSSTALGVKSLFAQNVEFVAADDGNYTLQDDLVLQSDKSETIKGGLKISSGSLTIKGGDYHMEQGKDLIIANVKPSTDTGPGSGSGSGSGSTGPGGGTSSGSGSTGSGGGTSSGTASTAVAYAKALSGEAGDNAVSGEERLYALMSINGKAAGEAAGIADSGTTSPPAKVALTIQDASLTVNGGKLETTGENGIKLVDGTLDARGASSYKIASASIELENTSSLHLDGSKILELKEGKTVEFKKDVFAEDAIKTGANGNTSTVNLANVGSMTMEQFKDLKTKTTFEGFFDGFAISNSDAKPEMNLGDLEQGTPDGVYQNTQVKVETNIDKSVSVGNVVVTASPLEITAGGGSSNPNTSGSSSTLVKLTNAGANGNGKNNFVQTADGTITGVNFKGAGTALQLQGTGNIGAIKADAEDQGQLLIGNNEGSAPGKVTVKGDIGASDKGIGTVKVQANSDLVVEGSSVTTQNLQLAQGSSLTAKESLITITAGKTGSASSAINGDIDAKELKFDGSGSHVIAGNASVQVENFTGSSGATIQVGEDKVGGLGADVLAKNMNLNGATLFVDPDFNVQASYHVVENLAGANDAHSAGTLSGTAVVGKNAVLAVGFESKDDVLSIIKDRLGAHGGFNSGSEIQNALVVNKGIKLEGQDKIVVDPKATGPDAATQATAAVTFGENTAMVITDNVYTVGPDGKKQGAAIDVTATDNKTVVADAKTTVLLSGKFNGNDTNVKIFAGATNAPAMNATSTNGLLSGTIGTDGTIAKLDVNTKLLDEKFAKISKPVREMLSETISGGTNVFDGTNGAGGEYIAKITTDSNTGLEADKAAHAAIYAGSAQASMTAVGALNDAMQERAQSFAHVKKSSSQIFNQKDNLLNSTASQPTEAVAGFWASPNLRRTKADGFNSSGATYGADVDLYGMSAGADLALGNLTVGAAASLGRGDAEGTGNGGGLKDDFDYYGIGAYASMAVGNFSLIGDASFNYIKHDISGYSGFAEYGSLGTKADSKAFSAGANAMYTFNTPFFALTPHFGTRFTRLETDSYNLVSAKGEIANTSIDTVNIISVPMGLTFSQDFYNNGWIVSPSLDLSVTLNEGDTELASRTHFNGMKKDLNLNSEIMDDVTYGVKFGLNSSNGNFNSKVSVNYNGSDNTDSFSINAGASYNF